MRISKIKFGIAMLKAGVNSSKQLAKISGISVNTISRSLNGGEVTVPTLGKLAAALGVEPQDILQEDTQCKLWRPALKNW